MAKNSDILYSLQYTRIHTLTDMFFTLVMIIIKPNYYLYYFSKLQ